MQYVSIVLNTTNYPGHPWAASVNQCLTTVYLDHNSTRLQAEALESKGHHPAPVDKLCADCISTN